MVNILIVHSISDRIFRMIIIFADVGITQSLFISFSQYYYHMILHLIMIVCLILYITRTLTSQYYYYYYRFIALFTIVKSCIISVKSYRIATIGHATKKHGQRFVEHSLDFMDQPCLLFFQFRLSLQYEHRMVRSPCRMILNLMLQTRHSRSNLREAREEGMFVSRCFSTLMYQPCRDHL